MGSFNHEISGTQSLPEWASKAILEQLDIGLIITTLDGNFRRMNLEAARLYGFDNPQDFERHLLKLTNVFELRSYPDRKLIPFKDWPLTKLRHGARKVHARIYVRRLDSKREHLLEYDGKQIRKPDGSAALALLSLRDISDQETDRMALRHDRERLKLAQKAARIGAFEWQVPNNLLLWSEEMEALYGVPAGSFSGNPDDWRKLLHPDDSKRLEVLMNKLFTSKQHVFETEWRVILPDGTTRNLLAKAEITYVNDEPYRVQGINMDITERRKAAEAYKSSVDRQSAFFKTALDAIVTIDESGTITEFNPAASRIFGYTRTEAIGHDMATLMIPAHLHSQHRNGMKRYLTSGVARILDKQLEVTAIRKGGEEFPAELFITRIGTATPAVFMGTLRDITKRKHAEQELRASEHRFRFMAESMPQKIFTAQPDGVIDYINPQWMEYLGMDLEHINKTGWHTTVHPDDIARVRTQWKSSIESGKPYSIEQRIRDHAGEYRWHLTVARAMRDEDGSVIKWVGSNTDIEDLKQRQILEERTALLTEQHEQLMMINRAKDEFISLASHQLRTPATGVKQYVGMLMQGYFGDLSDDQQAILKSAYDSNERQLGIINALLNVARLDAGKVTLDALPEDMSAMLRNIVEEQAEVFRLRRQTLNLHLPPTPVMCRVDQQLIRMVLENIIDNAGKYSPEGKAVDVHLRQNKTATVIEVHDQGVGMRKKDQDKLFQKFSRIDNELSTSASGSGLGLYWAKKIMDLHGGTIAVQSRPRRGSVFIITIPLMPKVVSYTQDNPR